MKKYDPLKLWTFVVAYSVLLGIIITLLLLPFNIDGWLLGAIIGGFTGGTINLIIKRLESKFLQRNQEGRKES